MSRHVYLMVMPSQRRSAVSNAQRTAAAIELTTHAGRPQAYRMTVFTANGYLCCLFANHAAADADHGRIDVRTLYTGAPGIERALYGAALPLNFGDGMVVPTAIDRTTVFPTMLEAGRFDGQRFEPTHRARRLLKLRYDRGYPGWVRLVQGRD